MKFQYNNNNNNSVNSNNNLIYIYTLYMYIYFCCLPSNSNKKTKEKFGGERGGRHFSKVSHWVMVKVVGVDWLVGGMMTRITIGEKKLHLHVCMYLSVS